MRVFAAVDPGARGCGVAVFDDGFLTSAAYVRNAVAGDLRAAGAAAAARAVVEWLVGRDVEGVVVEWPRVYAARIREGRRGADPNDLLCLAGVGAAVAAVLGGLPTASYAPSEWKGQLPHEACRRRVEGRLFPSELHLLKQADAAAGASLAHNVWDAVGVGLHHLGRLAPRRAREGAEVVG